MTGREQDAALPAWVIHNGAVIIRLRILVLMIAGIAGSLGCGKSEPPDRPLRPVYRFIDPDYRAQMSVDPARSPRESARRLSAPAERATTLEYPTATLANEARYVLEAPKATSIAFQKDITVSAGRPIEFHVSLPEPLTGASQLMLVAQVWSRLSQEELPSIFVPVEAGLNRPTVSFQVSVPSRFVKQPVTVAVRAYEALEKPTTRYRTRRVIVPSASRLEFGIGVLEEAKTRGPVKFRVEICEPAACDEVFLREIDPATPDASGWQDAAVDLGTYAGKEVEFVFEAQHDTGGGPSFSFPLWANPTVYAFAEHSSEQNNVVLISLDTLRADHLPTYGYRHRTAPFIAETFEDHGTVFARCLAPATATSGSHMSMFTGLQPSEHGVKTGFERLSGRITPIAESLRAAGIETAAVTEDAWLSIRHGFGRGFNRFVENTSPNIMAPTGQVDVTFGWAADWLAKHASKRFFLFIHTYQVHAPYSSPERYQGLFSDQAALQHSPESPSTAAEMIGYDQEIRYVDDELRELFAKMRDHGLDKNTVVILISDHGEGFLEHGFVMHGSYLHEEVLHVPLMLVGPGVAEGKRVQTVVSLIDIAPTILGFFNLEPPTWMRGASLVSLVSSGSGVAPSDERTLFSESWGQLALGPGNAPIAFFPPAFGVRANDLKLTRYSTGNGYRYELFNLRTDPGETRNLYSSGLDTTSLEHALAEYERKCAETHSDLTQRNASAEHPSTPTALEPAQEEKLRALGYLQ